MNVHPIADEQSLEDLAAALLRAKRKADQTAAEYTALKHQVLRRIEAAEVSSVDVPSLGAVIYTPARSYSKVDAKAAAMALRAADRPVPMAPVNQSSYVECRLRE